MHNFRYIFHVVIFVKLQEDEIEAFHTKFGINISVIESFKQKWVSGLSRTQSDIPGLTRPGFVVAFLSHVDPLVYTYM